MRIIIYSFKVFTIAGFVGIFILIPVNCSGNQLQDVDFINISSKRIDYFCSSKSQPHQFTILVSNIPLSKGSNVGNSVEHFFTQNHPNAYLSHVVVHQKSKVLIVVYAVKKLFRKIFKTRKEPTQPLFTRDGFLDDSNVKVETDKTREEVRADFVSFKSRYGAAIALHMLQSNNPT